jgi:hypothetical protein
MNAPRGFQIAALVLLLLVSTLTAVNSVGLLRLDERNRANDPAAPLRMLAARLAELGQRVEQASIPPDAVPQARFEAERQATAQRFEAERHAVAQRFATLEQAVSPPAAADELRALRDRLSQLEAQQQSAPPPRPPAPRPAKPEPPKAPEPSFQVIGSELRAGERFLAILPAGANALSRARLLRLGDRQDGWRLEALYRDAAVFSQAGQVRRLPILMRPENRP